MMYVFSARSMQIVPMPMQPANSGAGGRGGLGVVDACDEIQ